MESPSLSGQGAWVEGPDTRFVVKIGMDVFPVRGNSEQGWSLELSGASGAATDGCWYASLEELMFVLINLSVATDGSA